MGSCVLCLNCSSAIEYHRLDQCFYSSESADEIIKTHFYSFAEKIFSSSRSNFICSTCWTQVRDFHKFYMTIASNFLNNSVEVKEEYVNYEELYEDQEFLENSAIEVLKIEEVSKVPQKSIRKTPGVQKVKLKSQKATKTVINPEDDEKIERFAVMSCDLCDVAFDTVSEISAHYRIVHKMEAYLKCCDRIFKKRCRLLDHINFVHFNISYTCDVCGKIYGSELYLRRHKMYHEEAQDFICDKCGKRYFKKYLLRSHILSTHIYDNAPPTFKCTYEDCDKKYVNVNRLKAHIKYTHERPTLICEFCTKTFTRHDTLEEHTKIHTRGPEDRLRCHICLHFISDKKTYRKHMKNHETEKLDNTCHYCGKKSPSLNALKRHIKFVHETPAIHQCQYCPKSFKRPRDVEDHEAAIHTQQDLYQCEFCLKTFRSHSNMLSHRKKQHPDLYQKPSYMRDVP